VLKARYFKDGDFLTASSAKQASYNWKGIVHGHDLLKSGLVWRIGDGISISVSGDKWIPMSGAQRPLGRRELDYPDELHTFLSPKGGAWNEEMVHKHFFEGDVINILRTPVGRPGAQDFPCM
jgi:hypothetical protein